MRSGSIPGYRFFPLHFPRLLKLERRVVNGQMVVPDIDRQSFDTKGYANPTLAIKRRFLALCQIKPQRMVQRRG